MCINLASKIKSSDAADRIVVKLDTGHVSEYLLEYLVLVLSLGAENLELGSLATLYMAIVLNFIDVYLW